MQSFFANYFNKKIDTVSGFAQGNNSKHNIEKIELAWFLKDKIEEIKVSGLNDG